MGENYRFFDSIDGEDERFYTADEFAEYFRQFIRNGIFNGGENLKVSTDEKDMKISIKPGYAWIEGYLYKISGEDLMLEHGIADPSLNRIDRVVIRLDKTLENRYVKAFILEGTPAATPEAPELTRNDNVYEISLAKIQIIAGKSFIENYQITDERLDNMLCGLTTHLFEQIDTAGIFDEWQNYLIHKRNESNLSYDEFVATYQSIWNSWIDYKISEPGGEFYSEWKNWFDEVQDTTNLVTKSQFDGFKDTRGMANGLATLDEDGNVVVDQLDNVQHLKDFYGRTVQRIEFNDFYSLMNQGVTVNLFDFYKNTGQSYNYPGSKYVPEIDFQILRGASGKTQVHCSNQNYVQFVSHDTSCVFASANPINLTDIDSIDISYFTSITDSSGVGPIYFGIEKEISNDVNLNTGFDLAISSFGPREGSVSDPKTKTLDVSELSGEYYIKLVVWSFGPYNLNFSLMGINFDGESCKLIRNKDTKVISLKETADLATLKYTVEMPAHFLDWHSLNALIDTPQGTNVSFDIYDNHENLLKEDIKNGEVFNKFTDPIIQLLITLSRDSLESPMPTFMWLEIAYRGSGIGLWQKTDEITLDANTLRLDIQVPKGFNEIRLISRNISVVSSTANLLMKFDENTSNYYYSYHYGNNTGKGYNGSNNIELGYISLRSGVNSSIDCVISGLKEGSYPHGTFSAIVPNSMDSSFGVFTRNDSSEINVLNLTISGSSAISAGSTFEIWGR